MRNATAISIRPLWQREAPRRKPALPRLHGKAGFAELAPVGNHLRNAMNAALHHAAVNVPSFPMIGASPHIREAILPALDGIYDHGHLVSFHRFDNRDGLAATASTDASLSSGGPRVRPAVREARGWPPCGASMPARLSNGLRHIRQTGTLYKRPSLREMSLPPQFLLLRVRRFHVVRQSLEHSHLERGLTVFPPVDVHSCGRMRSSPQQNAMRTPSLPVVGAQTHVDEASRKAFDGIDYGGHAMSFGQVESTSTSDLSPNPRDGVSLVTGQP